MKQEQKEKLIKLVEKQVKYQTIYVEPKPIDRAYAKKLLPGKSKKRK